MELRQLEYVLAVAEERHFGRAAERLHVRQQSVSEQVRRLERELGAPLFARTSRRVALTAVGEAFLPEARATVLAARRAGEVARRAAAAGGGEVRVGYAEDLGSRLFELAAPRLARRDPPVHPVPVPLGTREQLRAIVERRLPVGHVWQPALPPELTSLCTTRERIVVVVGADDPLAAAGAVDPVALSGRPLALVPRRTNPWVHDHYVRELTARGTRVTVARQDAVRLDRLLPLVLAGTAIGLTTERAAAGVAGTGAVALPLEGPPLLVEHHLVWRADTADVAVLAVVDVVRELVAEGALSAPPPP
ncbi:LysR family transcriptional regulator [Actinomycetospora chlora]|uniref:LysR family transcriptional regulator n=1 Tax=Actinomycetospora chlora TaxID=663608 RepID=A0ABP9BCU1_9PSEU